MSDTTGTTGPADDETTENDEEETSAASSDVSDEPLTEWATSAADPDDRNGMPGPSATVVP